MKPDETQITTTPRISPALLPAYRTAFILELLNGAREIPEDTVQKRLMNLGLSFPGPQYAVLLFACQNIRTDDIDYAMSMIAQSISENFEDIGYPCYAFPDNYGNIAAILSLEENYELTDIENMVSEMISEIEQTYMETIFVGMGSIITRISELSRSNETASDALSYKYSFSDRNFILANNLGQYYKQNVKQNRLHFDWILGAFFDGNPDLIRYRLQSLTEKISADNEADKLDILRNIYIELTSSALIRAQDIGVEGIPFSSHLYEEVFKINDSQKMMDWFLDLCSLLLDKIETAKEGKDQKIVERTLDFISLNYSDPEMNIQSIADFVRLSPAYLGSLFYRERDIHLSEFINLYRIRKAQDLLKDTDIKIAEISRMTGYSSPNYFNNTFKRIIGMTPRQFRNSDTEI